MAISICLIELNLFAKSSALLLNKGKLKILESIGIFSHIQAIDQDYTDPLHWMHHLNYTPFWSWSNRSRKGRWLGMPRWRRQLSIWLWIGWGHDLRVARSSPTSLRFSFFFSLCPSPALKERMKGGKEGGRKGNWYCFSQESREELGPRLYVSSRIKAWGHIRRNWTRAGLCQEPKLYHGIEMHS